MIFVQVEANLFQWGDWFIALAYGRWWLLVSSGIDYGPFFNFNDALRYAGDVGA
jgi:hypothetical protein